MAKRIMIIDDEQDVRLYLKTLFEKNGYETETAQDGDEGYPRTAAYKPDLITLDLSMPGRDGGQVFEALRKDPDLGETPICIITGKPELRKLIYERDVRRPEGYLDKPVNEETLLTNVRRILELARS